MWLIKDIIDKLLNDVADGWINGVKSFAEEKVKVYLMTKVEEMKSELLKEIKG